MSPPRGAPPPPGQPPPPPPPPPLPRKDNNLVLVGEGGRVALVPYRPEHVAGYHRWMASPELREATASEPLTLGEEYDMQRAWAEDHDKLTFILLDPALPGGGGGGGGGDRNVSLMVGDVNLFWNCHDDPAGTAEVEVMVAEPRARRRGLAAAALRALMAHAAARLGVRRFVAKVGEANAPSLALFGARLGFREVGRSAVFREVTLELSADADGAPWAELLALEPALERRRYDPE